MAQPRSAPPLKRKHENELPDPALKAREEVAWSAAIHDRESKFVAAYSPSLKPKELQALDEISSATYKIVGWRKESNQQSINKAKIYVTASDDDGEKYAGKKIEKVLEASGVSGACVVARWWGGTMLGPARFQHIETAAKEAIDRYREQETERQSKKRRLEEELIEHSRLAKSLTERDQSIVVLRALADSKEKLVQDGTAKEDTIAWSTTCRDEKAIIEPKPEIDYAAMPLQRLRALAKARDATISFLLKRIDKAEIAAGATKSKGTP